MGFFDRRKVIVIDVVSSGGPIWLPEGSNTDIINLRDCEVEDRDDWGGKVTVSGYWCPVVVIFNNILYSCNDLSHSSDPYIVLHCTEYRPPTASVSHHSVIF